MAASVPEFIKKVLDASGLRQAAFAKKVRVSQGTISRWLNGKQMPNLKQWERVLSYVRQHKDTSHLVQDAPALSLDALVEPYGPEEKARIRGMVEGYLRTIPSP